METLQAAQRKIETAEDLESVVRTMKTLAAVSIRQYETAVESLIDYYRTIERGIQMVLWHTRGQAPRPDQETDGGLGAVLFGSDQGMCGQFNEQIVEYALEQMTAAAEDRSRWSFTVVGARAIGRLQDAGLAAESEFEVPGAADAITPLVQNLLTSIEAWRSRRNLSRILVFYNRRRGAATFRPHQAQLVPINMEQFLAHRGPWPSRTLPFFTMQPDRLLRALLRHYLFVSLFRACAESLAAENASRIAAMQAAEKNIGDRIRELRSDYHQLRQTAITEELLDVVGGFEALTG